VNVTPNHSEAQIEHLADALQETFLHFDIPLAPGFELRGVA
jgi:5-aminolevulinate synthase